MSDAYRAGRHLLGLGFTGLQDTLDHERVVTSLINELVALARAENDFATDNMLQWFVSEQVEEEETAQSMIDGLKLIGSNGFGIYTMDKELANGRIPR